MKILLCILGILFSILGTLPFFFSYPYNYGPNSGPNNTWELILTISYQNQWLYIGVGLFIMLLSMYYIFKHRKVRV